MNPKYPHYDTLTPYEINILELTIYNEVGYMSRYNKEIIATVIYNRVISSGFPDTVEGVIMQPNQFYNGNYYLYNPDDETKEVVKEVFSRQPQDRLHEATFYYGVEDTGYTTAQWFETNEALEYVFTYGEMTKSARFFKLKGD